MDEFGYLSVLLSIILGLAITQILKGSLPELRNLAFHIFIVTAAITAITRREWYHKAAVLLAGCLFGFYIALLFARLP